MPVVAPVNGLAILVILLEICEMYLVARLGPGRLACGGIIIIVAIEISFVAFLFQAAKNRGLRDIILLPFFIASNIASIIVTFASIYSQLGLQDAIRGPLRHPTIWDSIYFSIITLTTIGYGDITPSLSTRSIAAFEALSGYVIMGILISVLITIAQRIGGGR